MPSSINLTFPEGFLGALPEGYITWAPSLNSHVVYINNNEQEKYRDENGVLPNNIKELLKDGQ